MTDTKEHPTKKVLLSEGKYYIGKDIELSDGTYRITSTNFGNRIVFRAYSKKQQLFGAKTVDTVIRKNGKKKNVERTTFRYRGENVECIEIHGGEVWLEKLPDRGKN